MKNKDKDKSDEEILDEVSQFIDQQHAENLKLRLEVLLLKSKVALSAHKSSKKDD